MTNADMGRYFNITCSAVTKILPRLNHRMETDPVLRGIIGGLEDRPSHSLTLLRWSYKITIVEVMMKQYNIAEAKSRFSELVKLALQGEEVIIARDNKPLIRLMPVQETGKKRLPGSAKGQILAISADFDALPADFDEYA